ncbi:PIEZO2_5 [Blepharisma stoltei]|uniref:Piezo-type mechanosensitive ion channel component n=1 Tax=Blepharisma stoltei TaxID=1481888 RepID=A0AAU9JC34_9CILI|nr:unnamed protein product [Blepharisma stoltei]
MIIEFLSTIILLCSLWMPSVLSGIYLAFVVFIWWDITHKLIPHLQVFKLLFCTSLILFVYKFVMICIFYFAGPGNFVDNEGWAMKLLGVFLSNGENKTNDIAHTILPDILVNIASALSWVYLKVKKRHEETSFHISFKKLLCFFILCLISVSSFTIMNFGYLLIALSWSLTWRLDISLIGFKSGSFILSCISLIQFLCMYWYHFLINDYLSMKIAQKIGILSFEIRDAMNFIFMLLLFFYSTYCRRLHITYQSSGYDSSESMQNTVEGDCEVKESNNIEYLEEPIVHKEKRSTYRYYISFNALYTIGRLSIFIWAFYFMSWIGICLLLWLFYSVIDFDVSRVIKVTRFTLIPILSCDLLTFFIVNIIGINLNQAFGGHKISGPLDVAFQLFTIFIMLIVIKYETDRKKGLERSSRKVTALGLSLSILLENSNKFSLCVLFVIGLSAINIVHLGYMLFFLVFILNSAISKKYWIYLVAYTELVLLVKYIWILIMASGNFNFNWLSVKIIGLPTSKDIVLGFFPDNYLEWLLLLSAAMQLNAYRAFIKNFNFGSSSYRSSIITRVGSVLNQWVNYLYTYIAFSIIFLIIFLSDLNVFNFFRFTLMCIYLCMLLLDKSKTISQNLARVHGWWFLFNYYSGFLLVFRYLFQFMEFFSNVTYWESKILGIQVYSPTHLYQSMISDCLFVVVGVIFSRIYKRLHSCVQDDIGTFSLLIHKDEGRINNAPALFLVYCGKHFALFMILIASLISIYARLSLSMLFYIVAIGNYAIILTREFISGKERNAEAEIKHRCSLWNYLYIWSILCLIASYLCFLISRSFFNTENFNVLIWLYFFLGFNKSPDNNLLLLENYEYVSFVITLIIERYCIEYVQSHKERIQESTSNDNMHIELLKFVKVIIESLIPAVLLLIAFKKLTVVSIVYVFTVLCTIGMQSTNKRVKSCNYIVVAMTILQYAIYLSNLDDSNSPRKLPNGGQTYLNVPWYKTISWSNSDYPTFLNLGTNHAQVYDLICEILLMLLIQVYFLYFSKIKEDADEVTEINPEGEQSKLVKTLFSLKKKFYSSFNYIILCVGLLFISKSTGLISLVYCFVCLSFIWRANDVLKSKEALDNYIRLYRNYLIRWMAIEFTCQILYQIPAISYYPHELKDWLSALGLVQLWSAGENNPPSDISSNQYDVYFRIYAYGALLIAYRIMQSQEFKNYLEDQRIKLKIKSKCIGIGMAHHFNNGRIKKNVYYRTKQQHFEHGVKRLDRTVESWNRVFYENDRHPIFRPRKSTVLLQRQETLKIPPPPQEDSFKTKFQRFLIRQMNPILYRKYIEKLKHPKKESFVEFNSEEEKIEELDEQMEESLSFGNIEKEPENEEDSQSEFTLTVKDYFLIILFIIASNTQGLVYLIFFLNHFYNASLESLVYPISVCGYALLEYPRPPAQYFLIMQLYSEVIFFIKYSLQLNVWELIFQNNFLTGYTDSGKIGFNLAENTYSNNLVDYVLWDALCMLILLIHQFYLLKVGLHEYTEFELETLEEAYMRNPEGESIVSSALSSREEWSEFNPRPKLTCTGRVKALFQRLLPSCKEEKPGKDMYTSIILIQFLILIYLFCFFSKMSGDSQNISNSFQANQFPGHMVIALIFHIFVMLMERYLYLERTSQTAQLESKPQEFHKKINWNWQLVTALILHLTLLLAVHLIVFWYFPINGNIDMSGTSYCEHLFDESRCNNFQINSSLQWFYIIYMCYFTIIAVQLQLGLPIFRTGAFPLMKSSSMTALVFFQIYRGLPFLFELRTLIDWTFTTTSLSLFQWFKFEDIYARLYINKCDEEDQKKRKPGQKISKVEKTFMGACILLFILLCILAPLIIFSSLNPIIDTNPVKAITIEIGLKTDIGNYYQFFKGSQVSSISKISEKEWNNMKFDNFGKIQASDRELMQSVVLDPNPDDIWSISPSSKSALCSGLASNSTNKAYYLQMTYSFNRDYPEIQTNSQKNEKTRLSPEHVSDMNNIICKQTASTFQCDNCFSQVIKIPSSGSPLVPTLASDTDYMMGVVLTLVNDGGGGYWQVNSLKGSILEQMHFYVISYNYSPVTFNFSVITFYISVVYLVGRLLRIVVIGGAYNIQMTEMPNPDPLINLCTGIYVSRMTGDLLREEELYFELMDILRSPEIIKMVTGRSSLKNKTD